MLQPPEVPSPERHMLRGENDYQQAIDRVISQATKTVHIFDPNLSVGGYASAQRHSLLSDFLLQSRDNRLTMVLHETDYLMMYCPRIMELLRFHSYQMSICRTQEHARHAADVMVISDDMHYVHRFHATGDRFLLGLNDVVGIGPLKERFEQLHEAAYPAVFATTLGL